MISSGFHNLKKAQKCYLFTKVYLRIKIKTGRPFSNCLYAGAPWITRWMVSLISDPMDVTFKSVHGPQMSFICNAWQSFNLHLCTHVLFSQVFLSVCLILMPCWSLSVLVSSLIPFSQGDFIGLSFNELSFNSSRFYISYIQLFGCTVPHTLLNLLPPLLLKHSLMLVLLTCWQQFQLFLGCTICFQIKSNQHFCI